MASRIGNASGTKADAFSYTKAVNSKVSKVNQFWRKRKNRIERKRAKQQPDCPVGYGKFSDYAS